MKIFSEQEKNSIINEIQTKYQNQDQMDFENKVEILASLRIMDKFLGNEWYRKSGKWQTARKFTKILGLKERGTLETSRPHPITKYLGTGQPDDVGRLVNFANFLRNLYGRSNVQEKLRDYVKKEKRAEIQTTPFDKMYFELKSASYYAQKNFRIEFIKERKRIRTPDLKIMGKDGHAYLECKRKEEQKEYSIKGIINSIRSAYDQLREQDSAGIITVELPMGKNFPRIELSSLTEQIHLIFPELPMVSYVIILGEGIWKEGEKVHFTTKSRSVHNPHSIKSLPPSIEEVTKFMKSANQKSLLED